VTTHTYAGGSFEAVVTVTDDQGLTAQAAAMVFANRAPVAALGVSPAAGRAPLAVQFNASSSFDLDGQVMSYVFDFGDGTSLGAAGQSAGDP
jgi:PKD repeat protein